VAAPSRRLLVPLVLLATALLLPTPADAQTPVAEPQPPSTAPVLDVNRIRMAVSTAGTFATDPETFEAGLEFPRGTGKTAVYTSGLWLGGNVGGSLRVTVAEYSDEFQPGAIVNGFPDDPTRPEYKVYKLGRRYLSTAERDSILADYNAGAVPHGAPVVSVLPSGELDIRGDQMLWHVYNDANPTTHISRGGRTTPLGVEIQQTAYAFDRSGALGNTVFLEFKIINKSVSSFSDFYVSLWSDPDLGGAGDDLLGSDPGRSLGICYNGTNSDFMYGSTPPALGYDLLKAVVPGASPSAAASFNTYAVGQDPQNATQSYNFMRGVLGDGRAIIDPITQQPTTFFYTGDPVQRTGWLDTNPGDRRFLLSTESFSLSPGETMVVAAAIIIGDGQERLSSFRKLQLYDDEVQAFFDSMPECRVTMPLTLSPNVLNLSSRGRWITGHLEPPIPWTPGQIDVSSIRLNGTVPVDPAAATAIGDFDLDGIQELEVRFDRAALGLTLTTGVSQRVTLDGTIGGECFSGLDSIRVIGHGDVTFTVRGATPNPSRGSLQLDFSLRDGSAADLEVFDVGGRRVVDRRLEGLGPGWHSMSVDEAQSLKPGLYLIRLTQNQESRVTRAVVVR